MEFKNWEDEAYQRALAESGALRKTALSSQGRMAGRLYVPKSPWENFAEGLAGGALGGSAERGQRALTEGRQRQTEDWMGQMPSATTETDVLNDQQAGALMGGDVAPQPRTVEKPPAQQAAEMRDWAVTGAALPSAVARAAAAKGMDYAMTAPQRQAEAKIKSEDRQYELGVRAASQRELQNERLEAAKQRAADNAALRLTVAQMGQPNKQPKMQIIQTTDEKGNPIQKVVELKPGETFSALPKVAGGRESAAVNKEFRGVDELLEKATAAEQGLPHYSGAGTVVPSVVRQTYTSPNTKMADASVAALSAEKAHELYGAAFTGPERQRAAQFLPSTGDTADTVKSKLKVIRVLAEKKKARLSGQPDPHPNMYNNILEPAAGNASAVGGAFQDADKEARYQAWKRSQGK